MRREDVRADAAPIRMVQFTKSFHVGGTEVQVLELLRGLPGRYQLSVSVLDEGGPLAPAVQALGHQPEAFPLRGSIAQVNTLQQVWRLAGWLRRHRIQLVHVHDFYSSVLAVPAARLAGARVIVGRLDLAHWHGKARRRLLAQLTRMADHVVGNCQAIKRMVVEEEGIPEERVSVIHNGLDLPRFEARMRQPLAAPVPGGGRGPLVVHVANMNHPVKRQEDLLVALAQLKHTGCEVKAWLVGDGPRRAQLERQAAELGLEGTAFFLGQRPDVPALYARATLGVLCSNAEGMSNAVVEGLAAGLPMVVTRVGGNPDLVAHGERGLVVEPERPADLARALRVAVDSPERARAWGRAGREFVRRELSLERLVERHDAMYRGVLGLKD